MTYSQPMEAAAGEWEDVALSGLDPDLVSFFESNGLAKYARRIAEATDAETVEDLRLIDAATAEEVIRAADLKLVSAKKFRLALAGLHGEGQGVAAAAAQGTAAFPADLAAPVKAAPEPLTDLGPQCSEVANGGTQSPVSVEECVVICIDRSGSMGTPFAELTINAVKGAVAQRTRMEAVKAMFYAFKDRTESMGLGKHQLGLVQFDDKIESLLDLTPRLDRFEAIVDDVEKRGSTAIYSAILEAVRMLKKQFSEASPTDLRVLVLTDGQSNTGEGPEEALRAVNSVGAVVDAIIVGDRPDSNLRKIVSATGGECYQIRDLGEGFELLEAEGVVSLRARRGGADKPPFRLRETVDFGSISEHAMTSGAAVRSAPALAQDLATKAVVSVASLGEGGPVAPALASRCSNPCAKRLLLELRQVAALAPGVWLHSGEGVHIFPAPDNLRFWRALLEGPANSPFEGGVFAVNVVIPEDYPLKPPQVTFETPVYHCNVNDSGKVCLGILQDSWSPACSVPKVLETVRWMLGNPDTDNSLRQWIAEVTIAHIQTHGADTRYQETASGSTRKHASKSVAEWKQQWGC